MGELQSEPFQFTFNGFLKVAFHGSRITSDAGLILVRELDERLGLEALIAAHLSDSRQGANTRVRRHAHRVVEVFVPREPAVDRLPEEIRHAELGPVVSSGRQSAGTGGRR